MAVFARLATSVLVLGLLTTLVAPVATTSVSRTDKGMSVRQARNVHRSKANVLAKRGRHSHKKRSCAAKNTSAAAPVVADNVNSDDSTTTTTTTTSAQTTTQTTTTTSDTTTTTQAYVPTTSANAPQTTTTTAQASGPTSGSGSSGNKAGLGWPDNSIDQSQFSAASWCYNWSPYNCSSVDGIEPIPMMWGDKDDSSWTTEVLNSGNHWEHVLAFNEPEQLGQSNMTPEHAVELWGKYIENAPATYRVSPAVTTSPAGKAWMTEFLAQCTSCTIDYVAIHFYETNGTALETAVDEFYELSGKPIWVTEWADQDFSGKNYVASLSEVEAFMSQTQSFLDGSSKVDRYSWYGAMKNLNINPNDQLVDNNGIINALGKQYMGI